MEKTGQKPKVFRPPFGNYNKRCLEELSKDLGYTVVLWSGVDVRDWQNPSSNQISNKIINNVKQGDIILLHDYGTENTIKALDTIIPSLQQKGYKFVTVSERRRADLRRGHAGNQPLAAEAGEGVKEEETHSRLFLFCNQIRMLKAL